MQWTAEVRVGDPQIVADAEVFLVARLKNRDEAAFRQLVEDYQGMVYNVAVRLIGNREDAADLCQEVFLRVWRNLPGFRGDASLKTWIYQSTLNACRNRFRDAHRARRAGHHVSLEAHPDRDGPALGDRLPARGADPERLAAGRELYGRVERYGPMGCLVSAV